MKLEVFGAVVGGGLAATAALLAQVRAAPRPTLADVVVAEGYASWLIFLALAIMGGLTYLSLRRRDGDEWQSRGQLSGAIVSSLGWGTAAALGLSALEWRAAFVGVAVFVAGIGADFLTRAVIRVGREFALNPMQWVRDLRAGREMRTRSGDDSEGK